MLQQHPESKLAGVKLCELCEQDATAVDPAVLSSTVVMLLEHHPNTAAHGHAGRARELLLAASGAGVGAGAEESGRSFSHQAEELLSIALALERNCLTAIVETSMLATTRKEWTQAAEFASRGLQTIATLEHSAGGQCWWTGCTVVLSFLLGDASLKRLHGARLSARNG
jgi:hypothetical protein